MSPLVTTQRASRADLLRWRMSALGLSDLPTRSRGSQATLVPSEVNSHSSASDGVAAISRVLSQLFALQGQDWQWSRWALALRAPGTTDADVLAACNAGVLVRSWPMRGTVHLIAAEDIGWVQRATNHRVLPGAIKRRQFLGLDDATLHLMTDIAVRVIGEHGPLSREALGAHWEAAGVLGPNGSGIGPWRYHVIWWLSQTGIIVAGPVAESEPLYALADEWISAPRELEGETALIELAVRYARGRGPVQDRDFAWWTGLTLREARSALNAALSAGLLTFIEIDELRYWLEPELLDTGGVTPEAARTPLGTAHSTTRSINTDSPATLLLPAFDEHLLGYTDRTAMLDQQHFSRLVPGKNGVFKATVVTNGTVTGVFTRAQRGPVSTLTISPFPGETVKQRDIESAAAAYATYSGTEVRITYATERSTP